MALATIALNVGFKRGEVMGGGATNDALFVPFGEGARFVDFGRSLLILSFMDKLLAVVLGLIVVFTGGAFDNGAVCDGSSLAMNFGRLRIHEQITHMPNVRKNTMHAPFIRKKPSNMSISPGPTTISLFLLNIRLVFIKRITFI